MMMTKTFTSHDAAADDDYDDDDDHASVDGDDNG